MARGSVSSIRKPPPTSGLRWLSPKPLAKWRYEQGARNRQIREPTIEDHDDRGGLALAAASAQIGADPMVPEPRQRRPGSPSPNCDRPRSRASFSLRSGASPRSAKYQKEPH